MNASQAPFPYDQTANGATSPAELETLIANLVRDALHAAMDRRPVLRSSSAPQATPSQVTPSTASSPAESQLSDAVISLATLAKLPSGVRSLRVRAQAVVTPAARDWLRQRGVALLRGLTMQAGASSQHLAKTPQGTATSNDVASAQVPAAWWLADVDFPERSAAYVRQIHARGLFAEAVVWSDFLAARKAAASRTANVGGSSTGQRGLLISRMPPIHVEQLALLNGISAVQVDSIERARAIAKVMNPQVWVLDAERLSFTALVSLAVEVIR